MSSVASAAEPAAAPPEATEKPPAPAKEPKPADRTTDPNAPSETPPSSDPKPTDPKGPPPADPAPPSSPREPDGASGHAADNSPADSKDPKGNDLKGTAAAAPPPAPATPPSPEPPTGLFHFGSYGRMVAAANAEGGPGGEADIVAFGSRMDEDNYVEAELRREDLWPNGMTSIVVITLAVANPVFHYNGKFELTAAARNLYLELRDIGVSGLSAWAGSRMVRGDDLFLLNLWPLDNLNLMGAGVGYRHAVGTSAGLAFGATQPDLPFFRQSVVRPAPLDQFGSAASPLLNRQKLIGTAKLVHDQRFGDRDRPGPGLKAVLYGEGHALAEGVQEKKPGGPQETLPSDGGFVVGGQLTVYSGERNTHLHVFGRYASGLAAYGQFDAPGQLNADKTSDGSYQWMVAAGGNWEWDILGVQLGAYLRGFRDASPTLNYEDVDEGAVVLRPTLFLGDLAGISLEGTAEFAQRGVLTEDEDGALGALIGSVYRIGLMPYLSASGAGSFARPQLRLIYNLSIRDRAAQSLYPIDHPYRTRGVEHFIGLGAEWWFNSSSYGF